MTIANEGIRLAALKIDALTSGGVSVKDLIDKDKINPAIEPSLIAPSWAKGRKFVVACGFQRHRGRNRWDTCWPWINSVIAFKSHLLIGQMDHSDQGGSVKVFVFQHSDKMLVKLAIRTDCKQATAPGPAGRTVTTYEGGARLAFNYLVSGGEMKTVDGTDLAEAESALVTGYQWKDKFVQELAEKLANLSEEEYWKVFDLASDIRAAKSGVPKWNQEEAEGTKKFDRPAGDTDPDDTTPPDIRPFLKK